MSLIKKQSMTDKNRAAHQRNGRLSLGATSAEGKERSRAANLRHGFYSREREEALRALGEDPAELAALIEGTRADWRPANAFQARIAERLARLLWRMERAERIQESLAARLMQQHEKRRQEVAREALRVGNARLDALTLLEENLSDPRYFIPRTCFREFGKAFGEKVHGTEEEILVLMHRLRKPQGGAVEPRKAAALLPAPPVGPGGAGQGGRPSAPKEPGRPEDKAIPPVTLLDPNPDPVGAEAPDEDTYLMVLEELDAIDFPLPWPTIAVAEGAERNDLRELLWDLVREHQKIVQTALDSEQQKHEAPLSRLEQDEVLAAPHRHADLMRREQESCFRQFMRLGNFLMKFQNHATKQAENEGPPGYLDENPGEEKTEPVTNCHEPAPLGAESEVDCAEPKVGGTESEVRSAASGVEGGRPSEVAKPAAYGMRPDSGSRIPDKPRTEVGNARSEIVIGGSTSKVANYRSAKSLNQPMIR